MSCNSCCSDFDGVTGTEKDTGHSSRLKTATKPVKSSKAEQTKLFNGNMVALPKSGVEITPDSIFKAITKIAFKYKYKRNGSGQTYSQMKKTGYGDCWGFSDLILTEMKKYGVSCKIVRYKTNASDEHRSVLYKNDKNKWVDFPYREYGWNTKYNNMLNNTSGSKTGGKVEEYKGTTIGNAKQSGSTSKSQTTTVTTTKGYKARFQGYKVCCVCQVHTDSNSEEINQYWTAFVLGEQYHQTDNFEVIQQSYIDRFPKGNTR